MVRFLKKREAKIQLKASSLIEAIIALTILIIITSFIFLIMNNVNNRSNIGLKTRAFNEMNNIFNNSIKEEDFAERKVDFKNFYILCSSSDYEGSDKLFVFKVSAYFSDGKPIVSKQRLVKTAGN